MPKVSNAVQAVPTCSHLRCECETLKQGGGDAGFFGLAMWVATARFRRACCQFEGGDSALKRKAFRYDEELLERTHDAVNDSGKRVEATRHPQQQQQMNSFTN